MRVLSKRWRRGLSNLFNNLSATWIAASIAVPLLPFNPERVLVLITYLLFGIVSLVISIYFDR